MKKLILSLITSILLGFSFNAYAIREITDVYSLENRRATTDPVKQKTTCPTATVNECVVRTYFDPLTGVASVDISTAAVVGGGYDPNAVEVVNPGFTTAAAFRDYVVNTLQSGGEVSTLPQ